MAPADEIPWYADVSMPALLGAARRVYGDAIRANLATAGFDDMPRRGSFVLGAVANRGASLADAVAGLGTSKQAASQLVDALVMRGYLEREPDPEDRRRVRVTLTDRGRAAAGEVRAAVDATDAALGRLAGPDAVAATRRALGLLVAQRDGPGDAS